MADDKHAFKRALAALRELEPIVRGKHIGKPTEQNFGEDLDPMSIVRKYREDDRIDVRLRKKQFQGILDSLKMQGDSQSAAKR